VGFANSLTNDAESRASHNDLAEKFKANAAGVLSKEQTDAAIDHIMHLDDLADSAALSSLLASKF
jgi:hypothetical protein